MVLGKRPNRKGLNIWNEEIRDAINEKQKTFKIWLNNPTDNNKENYRKARKHAKKVTRQASQQAWEAFISKVENDLHGRQEFAYKFLKSMGKTQKESVKIDCVSKTEWVEHYRNLWFDETLPDSDNMVSCVECHVDDITLEELLLTIKLSKNRKASGLDGINMELIKYGGIFLHLRLLTLYNMCWKSHKIPSAWAMSKVVSIYKKNDRTQPENYRGISLLNNAYKIYADILK